MGRDGNWLAGAIIVGNQHTAARCQLGIIGGVAQGILHIQAFIAQTGDAHTNPNRLAEINRSAVGDAHFRQDDAHIQKRLALP